MIKLYMSYFKYEGTFMSIKNIVMPFEGTRHEATIMMLPYRQDTWRNNAIPASKAYFDVILAIAKHEKVYVLVDEKVTYSIDPIKNNRNIILLNINYNDAWARDTSPIFVYENDELIGVDFRFNAWGGSVDGLYEDYSDDDKVSAKICEALNLKTRYVENFILEGGSIHANGEGLFMTTEACLLSEGRNPHLTKEAIENNLKKYLGAKKVLWLPRGIYNDETNEHIDNIACFIKPNVIGIAWTDDENDPQYALSKASYDYLSKETDLNGNPLEIIKVVLPKPLYLSKEESSGILPTDSSKPRNENDRLAASYINFYLGQDFVILPKFNVYEDEIAYRQFKVLYPNKKIYQIDSKEILLGGGNIHCITMQIPTKEINKQ